MMDQPAKTGLSAAADESQASMETPGAEAAAPAPPNQKPLSQDEQGMYDVIVGEAKTLIFGKASMEKIVKALKSIKDPIDALAVTTANVMVRIFAGLAKKGVKPPLNVVYASGEEVFSDVAELATKARIHDFEKDDAGFQAAFLRAVDHFRLKATSSGLIDKAAMQEEMRVMADADKQGKLGDLLGADIPKMDMTQMAAGQGGGTPSPQPAPQDISQS